VLSTFLISLGLTLAAELAVALLWGLRGWELVLCALVNVLTNPLAVLLHLLFPGWAALAAIEGAAVAAEALYYRRYGPGIRAPWALSLTANGVSFCTGLLLNLLI